jgi:O-6-methylguanine DNA methyltransferase
MNPAGSRMAGMEEEEKHVVGLLREAASRLESGRDPEGLVERSLSRGTDSLFSCDSPVGEVFVGMSELGARLLGRADDPEEFVRRYRERFGRLLSWGSDEATRRLARRVTAALAGERVEVPADLSGATSFQRKVLKVVSNIPRGEVRPYAWVAREAGSPRASRAVGTVMANNPVPLLVPCHRVVRNDGTTGGYALGASEKIELLEGEGVPVEELARSPYLATPTTGIFCHATCRNARRIQSENRRRFRSAREAADAGYRPCELCRPVVAG